VQNRYNWCYCCRASVQEYKVIEKTYWSLLHAMSIRPATMDDNQMVYGSNPIWCVLVDDMACVV